MRFIRCYFKIYFHTLDFCHVSRYKLKKLLSGTCYYFFQTCNSLVLNENMEKYANQFDDSLLLFHLHKFCFLFIFKNIT